MSYGEPYHVHQPSPLRDMKEFCYCICATQAQAHRQAVGPDAIKQEQSVTFVDGPEGDRPPKPPHIRQDAILLSTFPTTSFDIQKLCCNTYALCLDDILQHGKHFIFIDGLGRARPPKPHHSRQIETLLADVLLLREPSTSKLGLGGNNQGPTGLQRRSTRWVQSSESAKARPKKMHQKKGPNKPQANRPTGCYVIAFWGVYCQGESGVQEQEHRTPKQNPEKTTHNPP
jgi:hypothetical protein